MRHNNPLRKPYFIPIHLFELKDKSLSGYNGRNNPEPPRRNNPLRKPYFIPIHLYYI